MTEKILKSKIRLQISQTLLNTLLKKKLQISTNQYNVTSGVFLKLWFINKSTAKVVIV